MHITEGKVKTKMSTLINYKLQALCLKEPCRYLLLELDMVLLETEKSTFKIKSFFLLNFIFGAHRCW